MNLPPIKFFRSLRLRHPVRITLFVLATLAALALMRKITHVPAAPEKSPTKSADASAEIHRIDTASASNRNHKSPTNRPPKSSPLTTTTQAPTPPPPTTATVTGRAIHIFTGEPIPNAQVFASTPDNPDSTTDADGRFTLILNPQSPFNKLHIQSANPRLRSPNYPLSSSPHPTNLGDVPLYPAINLHVLVVDDAGEPVEGAGIGFATSNLTKFFYSPDHFTNVQGEVVTPIWPTQPYFVYLNETKECREISPSVLTTATERLVQFTLGRATLRAEFYHDGQPCNASAARLQDSAKSRIHLYHKLAGDYTTFENLPPGDYKLEVYGNDDRDPILTGKQEITIAPGEGQTVRVDMAQTQPDFIIRVLDEEGNPIDNAKVSAEIGSIVEYEHSGRDGSAKFYDLRERSDGITFSASVPEVGTGSIDVEMDLVKAASPPIQRTIILKPARGQFQLTVNSSPHDTPMPFARAELRNNSGITLYEARRGAKPGLLEFHHLLPGEYELVILASGFCPEVHKIQVSETGQCHGCPDSVTMVPGAEFCFRAVYADGRTDFEIWAHPDAKYKDIAKPTTPRPGAPADHYNLPTGNYTGSISLRKGIVPFSFTVTPDTPETLDILLD